MILKIRLSTAWLQLLGNKFAMVVNLYIHCVEAEKCCWCSTHDDADVNIDGHELQKSCFN